MAVMQSLGRTLVPAAGTPVQIIVPTVPASCHSVLVQALAANTGKIFVGRSGLNKTTMVGVLMVLAVPTVNQIPAFSATVALAQNALDIGDLWIDADTNGEGVLVSTVVS